MAKTLWRRGKYIGRELTVNNLVVTVIGVAPPHFIGVNAIFGPDLWMPAAMADDSFPRRFTTPSPTAARPLSWRRTPQARGHASAGGANIGTLGSALSHAYPAANEGHTATVRPLRDLLLAVNGNTASGMIFASAALAIVVGIVLLIACSNVANLLLARSAARQRKWPSASRWAPAGPPGPPVAHRKRTARRPQRRGRPAPRLAGLGFLFGSYREPRTFPNQKWTAWCSSSRFSCRWPPD